MKFRKAMTALAMSSAMVMAVPGVLEARRHHLMMKVLSIIR